MPAWAVAPCLSRHGSYPLALDDGKVEDAALAAVPRGAALDVTLPERLFLVRRVRLPLTAAARASAAADVEMRQTLPAKARDMVWSVGPPVVAGGAASVDVYVLKRAMLARLLAAISGRGLEVRTVRVARAGVPPLVDNRAKTDRAAKVWAVLALLAALAGIGVSAAGAARDLSALAAEVDGLSTEKSRLADEAAAKRMSAEASKTSRSRTAADLARFAAASGRLALLANLTSLLPDDIWISELRISGDKLALAGFADGDVSAVMAALQGEAAFHSVRLEGPITVDELSRKSRFELAVELTR